MSIQLYSLIWNQTENINIKFLLAIYFSARKTVPTDPPVIAPHQPTHVMYKTYEVPSCMSYRTTRKLEENERQNINN